MVQSINILEEYLPEDVAWLVTEYLDGWEYIYQDGEMWCVLVEHRSVR